MKLRINGREENVSGASNILELVKNKKLSADKIVVEHNEKILEKNIWQQTLLKENDSIEIVSFVEGG